MRRYAQESRDEWLHITCPDDLIPEPRFEVEYDADTDPRWGNRTEVEEEPDEHLFI